MITELPGLRNFQLRFKGGVIHRFHALQGVSNASGLVAIVDRNGNTATIIREMTCPGLVDTWVKCFINLFVGPPR